MPKAFSVVPPEIYYAVPTSTETNTKTRVTIYGRHFGVKKGKVTLIPASGPEIKCTVKRWTMDRMTGESVAIVIIPKVSLGDTYDLTLRNAVGSSTIQYEVIAPE